MKIGNMPLPLAIIIAAVVISGAIVYSNGHKGGDLDPKKGGPAEVTDNSNSQINPENIKPVDSNDHIYGDINAPIKVVEFSDLECPYCSRVHPTLKQLIDQSNGQVAWVFRHFPLSGHKNAMVQAVGAECVAKLGGEDKFWEYINFAFSNQSIGDKEAVVTVASNLGLNADEVRSCIDSGEVNNLVNEDKQDASNSGARGTPHSIILGPKGDVYAVSGAQPLQVFQQVVAKIISEQ